MNKVVPGGLGPTSSPAVGRTSFMFAALIAFFLCCMSGAAPAQDEPTARFERISCNPSDGQRRSESAFTRVFNALCAVPAAIKPGGGGSLRPRPIESR
jgi:hypothetical protein